MKRPRIPALIATAFVLAGGAALTNLALRACSDYSETIYVNTVHPDADAVAAFAKGDLGLLQPGFARSYLVVAYRHMAGLGLDDGAQKDALTLWSDRAGIGPGADTGSGADTANPGRAVAWDASSKDWDAARKQVMGDAARDGWGDDYDAPLVLPKAYSKATGELLELLKVPGAQDPWVKAWVEGQDLVFSRKTGRALPAEAPAEAPVWFKQARAYQQAAALYYLRRYDEAGRAFAALAADKGAKDRGLCFYLAASCQAKAPGPNAARAMAACDAAMKEPLAKDYQPELIQLKDHVRFLQDPETYLRDLGQKLSGPLGAEDFHALLDNYTYAWDRIESPDAGAPSNQHLPDDPLSAWIRAFQSGEGAVEGYLAKPSLPWLVAALAHAKAGDAHTARLMADAAKVPSSNPAYFTLQYHLTRLEVARGEKAEAAKRIASFEGKPRTISFANAMRLLKRQTDADFASFLKDLPLHAAGTESDGAVEPPTAQQIAVPELRSEDKVLLQTAVPLDALKAAALDPASPKEAGLPRIAFEKALWLDRVDVMQALVPVLPEEKELAEMMAQAPSKEERLFILGLREGRIRNQGGYPKAPEDAAPLPALSKAQQDQAKTEQTSLDSLGDPVQFDCANVLAYAQAHPEDPRVPEALHQAVRLTRNHYSDAPEGTPDPVSALSAQCFKLLHRAYPKSEWTAKTKYHY